VRVPLVETTTGILFGFLYWEFGLGVELGIAFVFGSILLAISVIDLEHQLILNVVVFPYILVALGVLLLSPDPTLVCAVLGLVVGVALVSLPFLIYRRGMGLGDVYLGGLIGLMVGFPHVLVALYLAVVGGGLVAILLLVLRIKGRKDAIPFGPYMAAAAMITLHWGEAILDWYRPQV
jgi:leader peptidase (prepilin peptidase)/N-methyltransferase